MITFSCPKCGKQFKLPDNAAGKSGKCKGCGTTVRVPTPKSDADSEFIPIAPLVDDVPAVASNARPKPSADVPVQPPKRKLSVRERRLVADQKQLQAAFAGSSVIGCQGVQGSPPETYRVQYRVRSMARGADGKLVYRDQHLVEIQLTREYPHQSPKCRMLSPIFHPNIDPTAICVGDHWTAGERLVDLVVRIGEIIAYQAYNLKSPLDGEAAMWTDKNASVLPTDRRDLHPRD